MENNKPNRLTTGMPATLKTTNTKYFGWIALTLLVLSWFILDIVTKMWAKSSIANGPGREFIAGWLRFTYAENHAGAWGLFSFVSQDTRALFLTVMSLVSILIICLFIFSFLREQSGFDNSSKQGTESEPEPVPRSHRNQPIPSSAATKESSCLIESSKKGWPISANESIMIFGFGSLLGGALGNLHDRLRWGYVVDFIDWHRVVEWPIFNVADIAITLGMVFLAVFLFTSDRKTKQTMEKVKNQQPEKST